MILAGDSQALVPEKREENELSNILKMREVEVLKHGHAVCAAKIKLMKWTQCTMVLHVCRNKRVKC